VERVGLLKFYGVALFAMSMKRIMEPFQEELFIEFW
jgi:hypothetical protein